MAENGLIKINGENCHLDLKSEHVCEIGWVEHLKSKMATKFEKYTLQILEKLRNGDEAPINKCETDEVVELLIKLRNAEIAESVKGGVKVSIKNRKYLTKLIELKSWSEFLNWYDGQNNDSNITNNFSGSTIGQVIQSSDKIFVKKNKIKQTTHLTKKPSILAKIKSFLSKFWWAVIIPLAVGIILILIERGIIDIGT